MIPLVCAAIGGCLATASVMTPLGPLTALLSAPFGGSLCAAIVAFHLSRESDPEADTRAVASGGSPG